MGGSARPPCVVFIERALPAAAARSGLALIRCAAFPGRLAQLGERRLDKAEVTGSSPVSPIKALQIAWFCGFAAESLLTDYTGDWQGCWPLGHNSCHSSRRIWWCSTVLHSSMRRVLILVIRSLRLRLFVRCSTTCALAWPVSGSTLRSSSFSAPACTSHASGSHGRESSNPCDSQSGVRRCDRSSSARMVEPACDELPSNTLAAAVDLKGGGGGGARLPPPSGRSLLPISSRSSARWVSQTPSTPVNMKPSAAAARARSGCRRGLPPCH